MKYSCKIEIDRNIEKVVELWADETNFHKWQDGFTSIEHLSGTPNTVGAKSKIIFDDKHHIELLETIQSINLPYEKTGLYEHIHMTNTNKTTFESISGGKTLYASEVQYIEFNSFIIKMFAKLFPSKFKSQSQKWMNQFKVFAENTIK